MVGRFVDFEGDSKSSESTNREPFVAVWGSTNTGRLALVADSLSPPAHFGNNTSYVAASFLEMGESGGESTYRNGLQQTVLLSNTDEQFEQIESCYSR